MGTSHQYSEFLFHLTDKDFATPLGISACNRRFVQRLATAYGELRSYASEYLHKEEHSLELQLPFLQYANPKAQIVPILVGSFHHMVQAERLPEEYPEYDEFVAALCEAIRAASGTRLCVITGVDMAHVGPSFGDRTPLSPEQMEHVKQRDTEYLRTIEQHDRRAMFAHIAEDQDARRICGFPTMYTVLDLFDRLQLPYQAEIYDYSQAVDYQRGCAVTFAGIGLYTLRAFPNAAA